MLAPDAAKPTPPIPHARGQDALKAPATHPPTHTHPFTHLPALQYAPKAPAGAEAGAPGAARARLLASCHLANQVSQ